MTQNVLRYSCLPAPYCFSGFFKIVGSRAHFNTAKTMAADANQLQDLREFLLAGDEDSARRLTENLNPLSVVNVENVDFTKLPKDILGTVIDKPGHDDHRIAAQQEMEIVCTTPLR